LREAIHQGRPSIEGGWRQFVKGRRRLLYLTHIIHRRTFVGRRLFVEKGHSSREGAIHCDTGLEGNAQRP